MSKFTDEYHFLINEYKQMHEHGINDLSPQQTFQGFSLTKNVPKIRQIIKKLNISSLIDFGCGKAYLYKKDFPLYLNLDGKKEQITIQEFWGINDIVLYDPGVNKYSVYPKIKKDLVICADVLEHIPPNDTDNFLNDIYLLANKAVFFSVSTRYSKKKLKSGKSVHINIRSRDQWRQIFDSFHRKYPKIRTYFKLDD